MKPIPFAPGYFADADGAVWSTRSRGGEVPPHRLRPRRDPKSGYLRLTLMIDDVPVSQWVHRLVAFAFLGDPPSPTHQVRHLNGVRHDCRPSNLAWGTCADNARDRDRHGTTSRGERGGQAKITAADVRAIRRSDESHAVLGARFGISKYTISTIKTRRSWKHVED